MAWVSSTDKTNPRELRKTKITVGSSSYEILFPSSTSPLSHLKPTLPLGAYFSKHIFPLFTRSISPLLPVIVHGLVERDDGQSKGELAKAASRARQALRHSYNTTF